MAKAQLKAVYAKLGTTVLTQLLGDKITVALLNELTHTKRFSELLKELKCSSKTLSNRLKRLEDHGIVSRTLHAEVPPRTEYALTEKGVEFIHIIQGILEWENGWQ